MAVLKRVCEVSGMLSLSKRFEVPDSLNFFVLGIDAPNGRDFKNAIESG